MLPVVAVLSSSKSRRRRPSFARFATLWAAFAAAVLLGVLVAPPRAARAQQAYQKWEARYAGASPSSNTAHAIAVDSRGHVLVAGASDGKWLIAKYNGATGAQIWLKRYEGFGAGSADRAYAIAVDGDDNVIVTGEFVYGANSDLGVVKFNGATGLGMWVHLNDGYTADSFQWDQRGYAVAVDSQNNVVIAGRARNDQGTASPRLAQIFVVKLARDGDPNIGFATTLWSRVHTGLDIGGKDDRADQWGGGGVALVLDGADNVIVTAASSVVPDYNDLDYVTIKYNGANGALQWRSAYDSWPDSEPQPEYDVATSVAVDGQNNVFVTGYSSVSGTNSLGPFIWNSAKIVKYNGASGSQMWVSNEDDRRNHRTPTRALNRVVVNSDNNPVGVRLKYYPPGDNGGGPDVLETSVATFSGATGNMTARSGGLANEVPLDVRLGADDSVWVAAQACVESSSNIVIYADGPVSVNQRGPGYWYREERLYFGGAKLAIAPGGDLILTGRSVASRPQGLQTIRYSFGRPTLGAGFTALDIGRGNGVTKNIRGAFDSDFRVLWGRAATYQAQVWNIPSVSGVITASPLFTPSGYVPLALSVSPLDNKSGLLWNRAPGASNAGQIAAWTLPLDLAVIDSGKTFGPLPDAWVIVDQQTGGDGKARVLWRQPSTGKLALWRMNPAGTATEAGGYITAPAGWTLFPQIAVGAFDNKTYIVWVKNGASSQIAVWTLGGANLVTVESGKTYAATQYALKGFGVGADKKIRLAWARNGAPAALGLWTLPVSGANGVVESAKAYTLSAGYGIARLRVSPVNRFLLLVKPVSPPANAVPKAEAWIIAPNAQTRESLIYLGG